MLLLVYKLSQPSQIPKKHPRYQRKSLIKTSLRQETLANLHLELSQEYIESKQVSKLLYDMKSDKIIEIDLSASVACAGTRRGVHYDGPMTAKEANTLLQIRTGSLIKSWKTKCECEIKLSMKHLAEKHAIRCSTSQNYLLTRWTKV